MPDESLSICGVEYEISSLERCHLHFDMISIKRSQSPTSLFLFISYNYSHRNHSDESFQNSHDVSSILVSSILYR